MSPDDLAWWDCLRQILTFTLPFLRWLEDVALEFEDTIDPAEPEMGGCRSLQVKATGFSVHYEDDRLTLVRAVTNPGNRDEPLSGDAVEIGILSLQTPPGEVVLVVCRQLAEERIEAAFDAYVTDQQAKDFARDVILANQARADGYV
jgi:hypothetical protein